MVLFIIFFSIGAAALSGSILCDELLEYYQNKQLLEAAEISLGRLESLNRDYDVLLEQLQREPNLVKNIAPAALGTGPADANIVYPKATAEQLAAVKEALVEDSDRQFAKPMVADWLARCERPVQRTILFLAGSVLVLISFIWFGPTRG